MCNKLIRFGKKNLGEFLNTNDKCLLRLLNVISFLYF